MIDFEYTAPTQLDDAISQLSKAGDRARILAGGTDIIVQLREGLQSADLVVDVKKIPELTQFEFTAGQDLQLGASVPCWQIYGNSDISNAYSALTDAVHIIGGWQIQSRASVGGNLCNSSPAADSIPALIALDAVANIAGPSGRRTVPASEFCMAPGRNVLETGELLVSLTLPAPGPHSGSAYQRFIPRNEMDIAVVGTGSYVRLDPDGQKIEQARIALSAVAATPVFAEEASSWLAGQPINEDVFAEAGELAKKVASPIDDMRGPAEYRTHLVGVLTRRTLATACERARQ
ncbi:MAG: xanthine dehydrogenase family protein subunit M [Fuerstiella sp.]|nr:xanthine dehydrogenase family protein subunit M [Fuerstiella sp.]